MFIYGRFIKSSLLSRRQLIASGSAGLLAAATSVPGHAAAQTTSTVEGSVEDQLAIENLVHRYGMALDSLDREALENCFAAGVMKPETLDWLIDYHKKFVHTMHKMGNHAYRVQGDTAKGVTYCVASMVRDTAGKLAKFDIHFMYREEFVKQNNQWKKSKGELEIIFSTEEAPVQPGAPLLGLGVKPGSLRISPALRNR